MKRDRRSWISAAAKAVGRVLRRVRCEVLVCEVADVVLDAGRGERGEWCMRCDRLYLGGRITTLERHLASLRPGAGGFVTVDLNARRIR